MSESVRVCILSADAGHDTQAVPTAVLSPDEARARSTGYLNSLKGKSPRTTAAEARRSSLLQGSAAAGLSADAAREQQGQFFASLDKKVQKRCVYMYTHMQTYIHTYTHTHTHSIYVYNVYICIHIHVYIYTHTSVCVCVCVYFVYLCITHTH